MSMVYGYRTTGKKENIPAAIYLTFRDSAGPTRRPPLP